MLSALKKTSSSFRLRQGYLARSITIINSQQLSTNRDCGSILREKLHLLHLNKSSATVFHHFTRLSVRTMATVNPSTINLEALGNNFVKLVPTMEVNADYSLPKH